jgi:imidazolonepropionase-like amidohydrolase
MSRFSIVLAAILAACLSSTAAEAEAGSFYLVGGELHVGNGKVLTDPLIEVRDGVIASVSSGAASDVPSGAIVVDARGRWITPGLIAAGSDIGLVEIDAVESARANKRADEEPIRASYDPAPAIRSDSSVFPIQAIAGVTTAAVHPKGGVLSGQVTWIDLVNVDPVGAVVARRVAVSGTLNRTVGGSRAATLGLLGRTFSDAAYLERNRERYERRELLRDFSAHTRELEALAPVVAGDVPLIVEVNGASDIVAMLELANEFKIDLAIAGGAEAWRVAPELAAADVSVMLTPRANLPRAFDSLGARLDNAALLASAGVDIVIVQRDPHNLRTLTQEAGIAVAYGLDWETALTAVSLGVARLYGMEESYGSVEQGKVANLVVWSGDPFELSSAAERVFIRGREVPRVSRQTLLRDRYLPR